MRLSETRYLNTLKPHYRKKSPRSQKALTLSPRFSQQCQGIVVTKIVSARYKIVSARNTRTREHYRQMLQSFAGERKVRIDYVGLEEKQAFAHKLIEEGDLPEEVIRYSLFDTINSGCSIGANRNALLLYTPGELLFGADDDTECQIAPSPRLNMGLAFNPMSDFMQIWSFPDREAALQSVSFENKDVLAIHEQLLGRELKVCLADPALAADLEFRQVNTRQLRPIVSADARVATTFTGLIGDSG